MSADDDGGAAATEPRELVAAVLAAVDPRPLARREVASLVAEAGGDAPPVSAVLTLGKAAAGLARGAVEGLGHAAADVADAPGGGVPPGLVLRPHTSPTLFAAGTPPGGLEVGGWEEWPGGHPVPDVASFGAGRRLLALASRLGAGDHLLALVSGGGSACSEAAAGGLSIVDLVAAHEALLGSGLPIGRINAVRKHLSRVKGGLPLRDTAARVTVLVLSDVPGDDLGSVASGPFAADPTTYAEALETVQGLVVSEPVLRHLAAGAAGELPETVKPGDPEAGRAEHHLLAGGATAAAAARRWLEERGYRVEVGDLAGEAAAAGADLVARGRRLGGERVARAVAGETTVGLPAVDGADGVGVGGRNQELALAAARALAGGGEGTGRGVERVLALATDGVDGPTPAAGAVVDAATWAALEGAGARPAAALARHDSHTALAALGDGRRGALLRLGATGTNVADLSVYLRG